MNLIKVNWVYIINEHMLKSKRLTNYRFPYAILVSKLIDYFGIDTSNELNETIKAVSEIDNSTLTKMGFHKVKDRWVFLKGKNPQEEHGASNLNNEDGDEVVPMEDDTVQAAKHSCYVIHHSYGQEPSADHAGSQRMSSPSVESEEIHLFPNQCMKRLLQLIKMLLLPIKLQNIEVNPYPCLRGRFCIALMACQQNRGSTLRQLKQGFNIMMIKLKEFSCSLQNYTTKIRSISFSMLFLYQFIFLQC